MPEKVEQQSLSRQYLSSVSKPTVGIKFREVHCEKVPVMNFLNSKVQNI